MDGNNVIGQKSGSTISVMDLGKLLLQYAKDGDTAKVHELMSRGAPFTTDWVSRNMQYFAAGAKWRFSLVFVFSWARRHCI